MLTELPYWDLSGVVTQKRELKTKDKSRTWAYSISLAALGGTYEVQTENQALYNAVKKGSAIKAQGSFSFYNGNVKLDIESFQEFDPKAQDTKPAAKAAA